MASILTNTSAMVALQNLRSINNNLVDTQNQIATGKKISTAKDNSLLFVRRTKQPHQQEESHHRRNEIGIGDLPGASMMATSDDFLAFDDDRRVRALGHVPSQSPPPSDGIGGNR